MSSFYCEHCGALIADTPACGYITGCEHYPMEGKKMTKHTSTGIDKAALDRLGKNWMVRTDNDGLSHDGFRWAPIGEWTECPRWNENTKADCTSGGLFGQGPGGLGYAQPGSRFVFCETKGKRISVKGDKIKVAAAKILYIGIDAFDALNHVCQHSWSGSLDLSGCDLKGVTLPQSVSGWLDLRGCDLKGVTLPNHLKDKVFK